MQINNSCVFVRWYNLNILDEVIKIKNESGYDTVLSLDYKKSKPSCSEINIHYYNEEDFNNSGLISWARTAVPKKEGSIFRYNPELSLIDYKNKNNYKYYWLIEGDVRFTGNYGEFFKKYEEWDEDLIGCNVTCDKDLNDPKIRYFEYYKNSKELFDNNNFYETIDKHFRAFMPICRLSKKLLDITETNYKNGILGTNENGMQNFCYYNNLKMTSFEDFNTKYFSDLPQPFLPNEKNLFFHAIKR